jgi:broad specificity phosphatase PhoE
MLRAQQTAEQIADRLGVPWRCADGLEEHRRPFVTDPAAFFHSIEALFARPGKRVFGDSADETLGRFSAGIDAVLAAEPRRNVGVVTHCTVMALYAAPCFGRQPYDLWRIIEHPCVIVIDRASGRGVRIVDSLSPTA